MSENRKSSYTTGGLIFAGCMFLGMGLGYLFDQQKTGMFIGMGLGFIVLGILSLRKK